MNRQQKSCVGFVVSAIMFIILLSMLSGCAQITRLRVPMMAYYPPYEDYQSEALSLVTHIQFVPYSELNRWGRTLIGENYVMIQFREELADSINTEAYLLVRDHELAHIYESLVLGIETESHTNWLNYFEHIELTTGKRPGIFPWS